MASEPGREPLKGLALLHEMQRLAALQVGQPRGEPTVQCCFCEFFTRSSGVDNQHIACTSCGGQMVMEDVRQADGAKVGVQVRKIVPGWRSGWRPRRWKTP